MVIHPLNNKATQTLKEDKKEFMFHCWPKGYILVGEPKDPIDLQHPATHQNFTRNSLSIHEARATQEPNLHALTQIIMTA